MALAWSNGTLPHFQPPGRGFESHFPQICAPIPPRAPPPETVFLQFSPFARVKQGGRGGARAWTSGSGPYATGSWSFTIRSRVWSFTPGLITGNICLLLLFLSKQLEALQRLTTPSAATRALLRLQAAFSTAVDSRLLASDTVMRWSSLR